MSEREQNINDQIKAKIDELDLDTKITQVKEQAEKAFHQVKEQAGTFLAENREKVDEIIEKATTVIDEKTEGKYHDKVSKAKASFASGLDKLAAEARTGESTEASATTATATTFPAPAHTGEETPVADAAPSQGEDPNPWASETDKL